MPTLPFFTTVQYLALLRVALGMIVAHGAARLYVGSVGAFGSFLNSKGLIISPLLARAVTLNDLIGGVLLARAVHNHSSRKGKALVKINCAALPTTLIESELFSHEKGAFTSTTNQKMGRFELADGGTIFLETV